MFHVKDKEFILFIFIIFNNFNLLLLSFKAKIFYLNSGNEKIRKRNKIIEFGKIKSLFCGKIRDLKFRTILDLKIDFS